MVKCNNVFKIALLIAVDNNLIIKDPNDVIYCDTIDWLAVEEEATTLISIGEEAVTRFICGEEEEIDNLVEKYDLSLLDRVMDDIFDGYLHDDFFENRICA